MLDTDTKRRIDTARDVLVGKVPDPKSQVEQITIALIYKFMDDMDAESEELGGKRKFFGALRGVLADRRAIQRGRCVEDRALLRGGPLTITPMLTASPLKRASI